MSTLMLKIFYDIFILLLVIYFSIINTLAITIIINFFPKNMIILCHNIDYCIFIIIMLLAGFNL